MGHDIPDLPPRDDEEVTEASADGLPTAVAERAARAEPDIYRAAVRMAYALSPFALPVQDAEEAVK
jgi:hypothetical protein